MRKAFLQNKLLSRIACHCKSHIPHYCPICEKFFLHFMASGRTPRAGARCPECKSLERHRLLWLFIKGRFVARCPTALPILHIAAEPCIAKKLGERFREQYYTGDLSSVPQLDITKLPHTDNFFALIICSHVLEHIEEESKALKELYRVLEPNGSALILVPIHGDKTKEGSPINTPQERERLFGSAEHVRRYGRDFADRLKQVGFHTDFLSTKNLHGRFKMHLMSLRNEYIFICRK